MKVTYNGYPFNDKSHINIDTEVVYDEAGRVAIKKMLTITVKSIITPTRDNNGPFSGTQSDEACLNNDFTLDEIREKLCEIGGVLDVSGIGFGKLRVNDYNATDPDFAVVDMAHGPKPRVIRWTPIAGAGAAEIVWTIVTVVPPCEREDDLKSMNFNIGFSVNEKGYTTRRVSGFLEVINSDVSPGFRRSADDFRGRIVVAKITNSLRTQNFDLSADRSRLDFSIVDTEIESPNSYPPDVVSISAPLTMRIPKPYDGAVVNSNRLSVSLELTATAGRIRAWEIFTAIFGQRTAQYRAASVPIVVQEMTVVEDPYSNQYRFGVSWIVTTDFSRLLLSSGLFQTYPVDWDTWSQSMNQVQANRGLGQFAYSEEGQNDNLVSACEDQANNSVIVATEAVPYFATTSIYAILCNENPPPPSTSWEKFEAYLVSEDRYNDTLITTYGEASLQQNGFDINSTDNATESHEVTKGNEIDETLARGVPTHGWVWRGHARRIGHRIPKPGLQQISGIAVEATGEPKLLNSRLVGYYLCQPVYESAWSIAYIAKTQTTATDADADPSPVNNDYEEGTIV